MGRITMRPCVVLCSPSKGCSALYWSTSVVQFWITYNRHHQMADLGLGPAGGMVLYGPMTNL